MQYHLFSKFCTSPANPRERSIHCSSVRGTSTKAHVLSLDSCASPRRMREDHNMNESATDDRLRISDATIAWCLRRAANFYQRGDSERAALWAYVAAGTATEFGHSWLNSAPLESLLLRIGARLPAAASRPPRGSGTQRPLRWLHVFSMTF